MSDKLSIYKQLATPPADALKKIDGGRLRGMSDIKPQWRIEKMTEVFGACGIGWKYEITRQWTEEGCDGQRLVFCNVNLYFRDSDGEYSDAIPGTGGNMLTAKEKNGLYSSDEAYKMALTDALSVAMKMIGMAADVYRGTALDSKYAQQKDTTEKPVPKIEKSVPDKASIMGDVISLIKNSGFDDATMTALRKQYAEVKTAEQAEKFKGEVEKMVAVKKTMADSFEDDDIPFENKELF
jgi:hypothetical protein